MEISFFFTFLRINHHHLRLEYFLIVNIRLFFSSTSHSTPHFSLLLETRLRSTYYALTTSSSQNNSHKARAFSSLSWRRHFRRIRHSSKASYMISDVSQVSHTDPLLHTYLPECGVRCKQHWSKLKTLEKC